MTDPTDTADRDDATSGARAPAELWPRVAALTIHEAATRRHVLRSLRAPLAVAALALVAGTATITALAVRAWRPATTSAATPTAAPAAAPTPPVALPPGVPLGVLLDEDRALLAQLGIARDRAPGDERLDDLARRLRDVDASLREGRRRHGRGLLSDDARRALAGPLGERARIVAEIRAALGARPTPPVAPRPPLPPAVRL